MCTGDRRWVDRSPLFPAYLDLDGDAQCRPDAELNARFELGRLDLEYREKTDLLLATDKPAREEFCLVDSEGRLDLDKLKSLDPKAEDRRLLDIRCIAESLEHLALLEGKKVFDRDFEAVLRDRTVRVASESVDHLRDALQSAEALNQSRFDVLARLRLFDEQLQQLTALHQSSLVDLQ